MTRGERSSHNRMGGNGAIEQKENMHAATGSSKESSQVFVWGRVQMWGAVR